MVDSSVMVGTKESSRLNIQLAMGWHWQLAYVFTLIPTDQGTIIVYPTSRHYVPCAGEHEIGSVNWQMRPKIFQHPNGGYPLPVYKSYFYLQIVIKFPRKRKQQFLRAIIGPKIPKNVPMVEQRQFTQTPTPSFQCPKS